MPSWGEILKQITIAMSTYKPESGAPSPFDAIRREYLNRLYKKTNRNTILYATAWTKSGLQASPDLVSIVEEDLHGLIEVTQQLKGEDLDIILHSPGGNAEATEAIVSYLRSRFSNIRVIIPHVAMSAATMWACSANKITMGTQSSLGPVDPQMIIYSQSGRPIVVAAQAIFDEFYYAEDEIKKNKKDLAAWMPILSQYYPGLLIECMNASDLSNNLISEWLKKYMLSNDKDSDRKIKKISEFLSSHYDHKSHARHINRTIARSIGLEIEDLETDKEFEDLVMSVFFSTTHTFDNTPLVKLIENNLGNAYMKLVGTPIKR